MRDRLLQIGLALMILSTVVVGVWAQFAPRSFYTSFPGGGRHWVSPDGPFNEHLVRDVGGLNLGLTLMAIVALVTLSRPAIVGAALAVLVYSVPHLVYHASHTDLLGTGDAVAEVVSLAFAALVPAIVLVIAIRR